MAKKVIKPVNPTALNLSKQIFNFPLRTKYIILAIIGLVFYSNSLLNGYVFDDSGVILENTYVQMGISGIPKILTNDSFASYYISMGGDPSKQLSGGRFRPLSEIIFAVEQQLLGDSTILPYFCHLVNVLAYVTCIIAIFYFLDNLLLKKISGGSDVAFLSALLFAIHPIHTEVVANIKSLDEILSLLFIILTFIFSLKYLQSKKIKHLVIGVSSFFLALLSKEYAVTLVFFIPFLFYLLQGKSLVPVLKASLPYYGILLLYLVLRFNAIGFHTNTPSADILTYPYFYATHTQKVATEWFVLGKYLGLLFFPYPLSCDYSYNQIPYHSFSDISVLLSMFIYISIFIWGIILTRKRCVLSFAVFFFLFNIFLISNFVLDIGATMGERLVFHSSLGFVIILSFYLLKAVQKLTLQTKKNIVIGTISVIGIVCLGETVVRNAQWKDNTSLFTHDASVVPNSCLANNNAGFYYIKLSERKENILDQTKAYLDSSRECLMRALHFYKEYDNAYLNLGIIYLHQGMLDSAKYCWEIVKKLRPNLPALNTDYALLSQSYFSQGLNSAIKQDKIQEGINYMKKALLIDSTNASIWYDLGIAYYHIKQYDSAKYALTKTLRYKPDSMDAANAKKDIQDLSRIKEY